MVAWSLNGLAKLHQIPSAEGGGGDVNFFTKLAPIKLSEDFCTKLRLEQEA